MASEEFGTQILMLVNVQLTSHYGMVNIVFHARQKLSLTESKNNVINVQKEPTEFGTQKLMLVTVKLTSHYGMVNIVFHARQKLSLTKSKNNVITVQKDLSEIIAIVFVSTLTLVLISKLLTNKLKPILAQLVQLGMMLLINAFTAHF
jgi:uncharacterized membrane protein